MPMRFLSTYSCLVLLLSVTTSFAMDTNSIAGVYKERFKNGDVSGGVYQSENILEIVPYNNGAVYFRTDLEFFNGHSCALSGIAHAISDGYIFKEKSENCEFTLQARDGKITFYDKDGQCRRNTCGARGSYNGIFFTTSQKRPIRYMERLKSSLQYRAAIKHDSDGMSTNDAFSELWENEHSH